MVMDLVKVLQFEGPADVLVWKSSKEDFNTSSQLIVDETHEALLVKDGEACDLFGAGRHTLSTNNIPFLKKFVNFATDGETPFKCKVFYVNKVHQMDITWGIPGEITINDPIYDIFLHVGMCGSMNFKISDSRKFLLKIVGFRDQFNSEEMISKFRGIIKQYVKNSIAKMMNREKISYFDMNENLLGVSNKVQDELEPIFDEYGIEIVNFIIETITVPDSDYDLVMKAKAVNSSRHIQGYTWQEEKQMDVAKTFAGNEGTLGGIGGAVGGFMVGGAFAGGVADIAKNAMNPNQSYGQQIPEINNNIHMNDMQHNEYANASNATRYCSKCGNLLMSGMLFCSKCGTQVAKECPNCHTELAPNAMFCHKCGTQI
jgi:membrane protease subunit (stomatin/prohibitin family)